MNATAEEQNTANDTSIVRLPTSSASNYVSVDASWVR